MGDYRVPRRVDEAGNQDGIVCGRALPDGFLFGWAITANGLNPTVDVLRAELRERADGRTIGQVIHRDPQMCVLVRESSGNTTSRW